MDEDVLVSEVASVESDDGDSDVIVVEDSVVVDTVDSGALDSVEIESVDTDDVVAVESDTVEVMDTREVVDDIVVEAVNVSLSISRTGVAIAVPPFKIRAITARKRRALKATRTLIDTSDGPRFVLES